MHIAKADISAKCLGILTPIYFLRPKCKKLLHYIKGRIGLLGDEMTK
jgi:hypothetical protein